jgi:MFS family permease
MARPILAVIFGTFTLRLATGITGSMLVYYFADFPLHGGEAVTALQVGIMGALFYASELIGSPIFGVLSDRIGHRRVMLIGPAFGAVAVIITAFTVSLPVIGFTRLLEGASTAASVPSILGFIAFATAGNELLRGKAVARFEAATLAGLLSGFVVGGLLFQALGPMAFLANALVYLVSFLIYRYGVPEHAEPEPSGRAHDPEEGLRRYLRILRGSHVWLLAPTWIAINATLGLFTSQTLFQLVREPAPQFADQALMGGFEPWQMSVGLAIGGLLFFAGLFYWGGKFKDMRRTTIILYGIIGGAVMLAAAMAINHYGATMLLVLVVLLVVAALGINHFGADVMALLLVLVAIAAGGLFVLAGATPAAIGLLADMTEAYPNDRGAIMGLYSVFLGLGQIIGSIAGGVAAQWRGLDGILLLSFLFLGIALLPISHLRRYEHLFGETAEPAHA